MPFLIKFPLDLCKTKEVIIEHGGMLGFIFDCNKSKKTCDKVIDSYSHVLKFVVLECNKTQTMYDKAVEFLILQYNLFLTDTKLKKYLIKLLIIVFLF